MTVIQPSLYLRRVLLANAAGNGSLGAAAILLTQPLATLLGLPPAVLIFAGIYLVAHAGVVSWLANREQLPSMVIWLLMGFNAAWSFESIALLALQILSPNLLGTLVICAEAWITLMFVELQHAGLRRSTRTHIHTGRTSITQS